MSQDPGPAGLPESVEYQPLPNIYRAFAAGASPYAIITETVDNSIDFVRRQALNGAKYPEELQVLVRYESNHENDHEDDSSLVDMPVESRGPGRLIITDNAGGVPPTELARFFQLGHTDAPPEGIGRFGVGAKRLIGIGDRIKYESHAYGYEVGAGFEVDATELETADSTSQSSPEETYQSEVYQVDDLDEGSTRIVVEDLNSNVWANLIGRNEDEEIDRTANDSLWRLGETYEHFLSNGIDVSPPASPNQKYIDFELTWQDDERSITIDSPAPVQLSLLPFDGLHPRRYEDIPFANSDDTSIEDTIRADITVGLMPSSDPKNAGLTVTMNNRNVLFRDTENDLFSTRYLGKFRASAGHGRLYCVVELYGKPEYMPWSDTKDGLDGTEDVTSHILNITENALSEYRRQNYDNLPQWMLSPYAENKVLEYDSVVREELPDGIETIPKSKSKINSPRFNSKPGRSQRDKYYRAYPERDDLIRTTRLHSELRIRSDEAIEPKSQPAYREFFADEYAGDDPVQLPANACLDIQEHEIPVSDNDDTPLIEDIQKLASEHQQDRTSLNHNTAGVPRWLLPRYNKERHTNDEPPTDVVTLDEFDFAKWRLHNSVSEDIRTDPEPDAGGSDPRREPKQQPQSEDRTAGSVDGENKDQRSILGSQKGTSGKNQETVRHFTSNENSSDTVEPSTTFDEQARGPPTAVPHQFTAEQLETLSELLGIDTDSEFDELFDALVAALEERQQLRRQLLEVSDIVNLQAVLDESPAVDEEISD